VDLIPDVRVPRTAIIVADLLHLPVMAVVVALLDPMAGILMTMATVDVATPDPLTVAMVPLAVTVRDPPITVDTAGALLRLITVMAAVVALPVPMGAEHHHLHPRDVSKPDSREPSRTLISYFFCWTAEATSTEATQDPNESQGIGC